MIFSRFGAINFVVHVVIKMADPGKLVKMEVDYSQAVDQALPECQELVKVLPGGTVYQLVTVTAQLVLTGRTSEGGTRKTAGPRETESTSELAS